MVLMTYHNPLQGVSFRVVGVASNATRAKEVLIHYFAGHGSGWNELNGTESITLVRWIDRGSGHCYMIQEVEVFS